MPRGVHMLLTQTESGLIAMLRACLTACHIQGVSSFADAVALASEFTPPYNVARIGSEGSVFLFQSGETITPPKGGCYEWRQRWTILVSSRHTCEYTNGRLARAHNLALVQDVVCCLDLDNSFIRVQSPALDQPPGLGLTLALVSYEVPVFLESVSV